MSRKAKLNLLLAGLLIALLALAFGLVNYYNHLPQRLSQHETIVVGQNHLVPGSQAALRILVRDSSNGAPLSSAEIQLGLRPKNGGKTIPLYTGKTGANGTAEAAFRVPENVDRDADLVIQTRSKLGGDTVERPVTIDRDYRVLLTTDKPI